MEILNQTKKLNVKCFKWSNKQTNRKYDEMFDYETKDFQFSEFEFTEEGQIIDNFSSLVFDENVPVPTPNDKTLEENETKTPNRKFLSQPITIKLNQNIHLEKEFVIKFNKYAYIVSKYLEPNSPYDIISSGSFLRIGKFNLMVKVFKLENEIKLIENKKEKLSEHFPDEEEALCRFCFKSESEVNNDIVAVCNCKGSLKYVHIDCLMSWLKNRIEITYEYLTPNVFKIKIKNFYCEICKQTFPVFTKNHLNEVLFLLDFLKTKNNYILLHTNITKDELTLEKIKNNIDIKRENVEYLYLEFNKYNKSFLLGRDVKSDVVLNDVSVSRKHCSIYLDKKNNCARIKDHGSKFGTLLSMQDDIIINEKNPKITLQKGNTVYHIKLKQNYF